MKIFRIFLLLYSGIFLLSSCKKDNNEDDELPPWNKSNTISLFWISKFDETPLFSDVLEYIPVIDFLKDRPDYSLAVFENSDFSRKDETMNASVSLAKSLRKIQAFARLKMTDRETEGSGLLLQHTISNQKEQEITQDCFLKTVQCQILSSKTMDFATVRISRQEHVTAFTASVVPLLSGKSLIVGTLKKEQIDFFKETLSGLNREYRLSIAETSSAYVMFTLSGLSWITREIISEKVGMLDSYYLQIEMMN